MTHAIPPFYLRKVTLQRRVLNRHLAISFILDSRCRGASTLPSFSDLMVEVFGDAGRHTRSALGAAELYADIPIEIEALFEVAP